MEDYINVSPTSGTGNRTVSVTAKPNPSFSTRQTSLNVATPRGEARSVTVEQLGVPFSIDLGLTATQHDPVIPPFMGGIAFNRSSELVGSYIRQGGTIYVPSDDGDLTNASVTLFPRVLILSSLVVDGRDMIEIEYILQRSNGSIVYENLTSLPKSGTTGSYSAYQNSSLDPLYIEDGITLGVTFYLTDASTEEKTVLKTYKLYIYK